MTHLYLEAGVLTINGTFIVETIGFLLMLLFLAKVPLPFLGIPKPVFPWIIDIAEARQREITASCRRQSRPGPTPRGEAEGSRPEAGRRPQDRDTVIEGANRSGEQLRADLRQKAEAEYQRILDSARRDIEAERDRALESARDQVAGLVVAATEKVIGEPRRTQASQADRARDRGGGQWRRPP